MVRKRGILRKRGRSKDEAYYRQGIIGIGYMYIRLAYFTAEVGLYIDLASVARTSSKMPPET